jgi:pimeloyl-ACP methyl ester carboxylesterase
MKWWLAWTLFCVLLSCAACGGHDQPKVLNVPGEPGHLYEVNGHHVYMQCAGYGAPAVILEAGYGSDHRVWNLVEPKIERTTRLCSYDRAGLGLSSAEHPKPRDASDQVADLEHLLDLAGIDPPYVVVGHSYGGVLAWLFSRRHRGEVQGLVLLDSSHPDQTKRFRAALPPARKNESEEVRQLRDALSGRKQVETPENVDFNGAMEEAGDLGSLGTTRLVVITAGQQEDQGSLPRTIAIRLRSTWLALQDDYARRSTDSLHVLARYSPHFIQSNLGQPGLVVKAVREVVLAARSGRRLHECPALFRPPGAKCLAVP